VSGGRGCLKKETKIDDGLRRFDTETLNWGGEAWEVGFLARKKQSYKNNGTQKGEERVKHKEHSQRQWGGKRNANQTKDKIKRTGK